VVDGNVSTHRVTVAAEGGSLAFPISGIIFLKRKRKKLYFFFCCPGA
jgi:hypothetical protein